MKMNLEGRVANSRLSANAANALWPLHEAIVNSIHAIEVPAMDIVEYERAAGLHPTATDEGAV